MRTTTVRERPAGAAGPLPHGRGNEDGQPAAEPRLCQSSAGTLCLAPGTAMLTEYIRAAMQRATYDKLEDGTYYGEVPGLQGLYANEPTLEACRTELQSSLEDCIVFG